MNLSLAVVVEMRASSFVKVFILIFKVFVLVVYCEEIATPGSGSLCMNEEPADGELKLIGLPKEQQGLSQNVYVMPKGSEPFSVMCVSQNPVNWTFSGVMSNSKVHIERYRNHEATCHVMRLRFDYFAEEQTGIYTCYEIGRLWTSQNFTLFAGRESAYLRFRGRTIDINQPLESADIYLPCSVNDPNVTVTLMKQIEGDIQGWKFVEKSEYKFDPIFGYKLKFNSTSDSLSAKYKCETGISPADSVQFNYKLIGVYFKPNAKTLVFAPLPATHEFECRSLYPVQIKSTSPLVTQKNQIKPEDTDRMANATLTLNSTNLMNREEINGTISCLLTGNDTIIWTWNFRVSGTNFKPGLSFDSNTGTATCNSAAPDSLQFYRVFCELLTKCEFMSPCFEYSEDWRCCAFLRRQPDVVSSNETSVIVDMPPVSGALRCFGVDVDEIIFLHTDTSGKLRIDDDQTNKLRVRLIGKTSIIEGETITAECLAAQRLFYNILKFELWKDKQRIAFVQIEEFVKDENKTELGLFKRKAEIRVLRTDVNQLRCFAEKYEEKVGLLVWDQFNVQGRNLPPTIFGPKLLTVNLKENSGENLKNLTCEAEDYILPKITWSLPPSVAESDVDIDESHSGLRSTSELVIPVIEKRFEGTYSCSARNKYDISQKVFQVVIHGSSINWPAIIIAVLVVAILVGAGVVAYFWRTMTRTSSQGQMHSNPFYQELEMLHPNAQLYLEQFRQGKLSSESEYTNLGFEDHEGHYVAVMSAYDPEEYEIPIDLLKFDRKDILGAGEQGIVFKGILEGGKFGDPTQVAIKTLKQNVQFDSVKTLLTEIKVLIYIGSHSNIVSLIGACTETSNVSELCLVTNFCSLGTLERYLRDGRRNFQNLVKDGQINVDSLCESKESTNTPTYIYQTSIPISTIDLIHWAIQIANGMEYLAEKRVIHGDLATRNVLLDDQGIAKISDFGLSKRLYQYTQYVKQQQVALPWRWMAIESLRDLNFSSNSDVWSYGVTIWEVFTMAEVPYPGIVWSLEFLQQLLGGLRMLQPQFATEEIYSLMLQCWKENPQERSKISALKEELWRIVRTLHEDYQNPRPFVD